MGNEINATEPKTSPGDEKQSVTITVNIGLFFDGTNNNAVQSMIALHNRRQKFFKKYEEEIRDKFPNKDVYSLTRKDLKDSGIGTVHELDNIFGYSQSINLDIEKSIANVNQSEYQYSSAAEKYDGSEMGRIINFFIDDARREKLNRMAGNNAQKWIIFKNLASISTSKGSNYTNIATLNSLYKTNKVEQGNTEQKATEFNHSIYIEGTGANEEINVIRQAIKIKKSALGLGFGVNETGMIQKCRKAIQKVKEIYEIYAVKSNVKTINCYFDIFGFSRGATTARSFTYILNPNDTDGYVDAKINKAICGTDSYLLKKKDTKKLGEKQVRALGLYDTVSSIGVLREGASYLIGDRIFEMSKEEDLSSGKSIFHDTNVDDFGLHSTDQANAVLHVCALDEFRKNFALVDIRNCTSTTGLEIYIPGCHTDIGGGASFGLDNFKIINCDEIATRGDILYNLYIRIEGLCEAIDSIKYLAINSSAFAASLSNQATIPVAYKTSKNFIPIIHKGIMGLFAFLNGYESIEAFRIRNGQRASNQRQGMNGAGYSVLADLTNAGKSIENAKDGIPSNIKAGVTSIKSLPDQNLKDIIITTKNLYEMGKQIISLLVTCYESIKTLCTDLEQFVKKPHSLGADIMVIINNEINVWRQLGAMVNESIETLDLIFSDQREPWVIPLEQRRICMYTGIPYDSAFTKDKSKKNLIKPLCIETLKEMGWLKDDVNAEFKTSWTTGRPTSDRIEQAKREGKSILVEKTKVAHFFNRDNIGICKYSKPGYTLIALKAMHTWANKQRNNMFDDFPVGIYDVPKDIEEFYKQVISQVKKSEPRKEICIPNDDIEGINGYKYLRQHYLHISINQQALNIGDNGVVNGPSFMAFETGLTSEERDKKLEGKRMAAKIESYNLDNVITRRIYPGVKSSGSTNSAVGGKDYVDTPSKAYWYLDCGE